VAVVEVDDPGVASRFASGDPDAVRELYQRYGGLVFSVAHKVLGDAALAEDAAQQTFVQAWRAAASYDPSRSMAAWLAGIARNAAIDVHRRERRHRTESLDAADQTLHSQPPSIEQLYAVWQVREAIEKLTDQDRELVRLQHFGELTHSEIADKLDIPIGTVKSRSYRAHRRLADLLGHLRAGNEKEGRSHERR